jgi:ion channel/pentapeptide repeat protein
MTDDPLSGYEEFEDEDFEWKFGRRARRNVEQLALLMGCSEQQDMVEWNEWRKEHREVEIWLEGSDLKAAQLEEANLWRTHMEGAILWEAHMEGADLNGAHLEGADLYEAHLEGADLQGARLEGARLVSAYLEGAKLAGAHLEWADLEGAHLERAELVAAHLQGASFSMAIVDGETSFNNCRLDRDTDFSGVGMGSCRMEPGLRDTLEYNIRRMRYRNGSVWERIGKSPANFFWLFSDYGRSTGRVIATFLVLSLAFAVLYYVSEIDWGERLVQDLSTVTRPTGEVETIDWRLVPFRALYFSVVTMTTLGFGDMHADPHSFWGHAALMLQVILGYVLLGALICRLGILFQGHGAPVKFRPPWDDTRPTFCRWFSRQLRKLAKG